MTKFILLGLDGGCPDIIDRAIADGLMPNFLRLREMGCWADNVPFPSAVTPGNWASIATGSKPVTNGISDFVMRTPGAPLDESHEVFGKESCRAEFAWDAYSDRGYKAATISFPGSLPQTHPRHLAIGNGGLPAENAWPHTIAPSRGLVAGDLNPVGPYDWREYESVTLTPCADAPDVDGFAPACELRFTVRGANPGFSGEHAFTLYLGEYGGQEVGVLADGEAKLILRPRQWSPFIRRQFGRDDSKAQLWQSAARPAGPVDGEFRVRITQLDLRSGRLLLYITTVYPVYDFSSAPDETRALRDRFGPYSDNLPTSRLLMGWVDDDGFHDEFRLQGVWQAKAALALVNEMGYKAVFAKWHAFDKLYHFFMHKIDPAATGFRPDEFERYERMHRMLLTIADEMVGIVVDGLDEDTSLVVVSDHGLMASRRSAWVNRYLAQHGYIVYEPDTAGKYGRYGRVKIDWSRTRAFVSAFLILNINLKGRDPEGIVEPGREYESLKEELIDLLRGWTDPETGRHVMADVFDAVKEGAFYGLGSDADGDIRYFTAPGYTLYRSIAVDGEDVLTDVVGPYLGDHGSCRPTTRYGRGSEVAMFYAAGKGFRATGKRSIPIFPCDIISTLLHIAGEPPLANQEGAVLHDLI